MTKSKRILIVGNFRNTEVHNLRMQARMWLKGLVRLGHDVQAFSYRDTILQCSRLPGKKLAEKFAKRKVDALLLDLVRSYRPEIVIFLSFKGFDISTVASVRECAKDAFFISREEDPLPENFPHRIEIAKQTDLVTITSEGRFLKTYVDAGLKSAFVPNMCDPDTQYRYPAEGRFLADVIFTGKPGHKSTGGDNQRYEIVERLSRMPNSKVYGAFGAQPVDGLDYFRAISTAKICLSINAFNDVRFYHSDRLINYLSCGAFVLAKTVTDSHLLFRDNVHLRYFNETDEFFELADWYLKHDDERQKIADSGMLYAHQEYNCTQIAGYIMELVEKGSYKAPWNAEGL